jgi:osmotically-inducible protein OsmY
MTNHRSDLEITRSIRQSLVKDPHLSLDAHNIKIITQNGKVILKGPVRSDEEKAIVAEKAKTIAGSKNVEDQLQVTNRS